MLIHIKSHHGFPKTAHRLADTRRCSSSPNLLNSFPTHDTAFPCLHRSNLFPRISYQSISLPAPNLLNAIPTLIPARLIFSLSSLFYSTADLLFQCSSLSVRAGAVPFAFLCPSSADLLPAFHLTYSTYPLPLVNCGFPLSFDISPGFCLVRGGIFSGLRVLEGVTRPDLVSGIPCPGGLCCRRADYARITGKTVVLCQQSNM